VFNVIAIGPKVRGFKRGRGRWILRKGKGSKSGGLMSKYFTAGKKSLASMKKNTSQGQIYHYLRLFLLLCD
jgi:hypothetical protein